jgi:O-antigen ligase
VAAIAVFVALYVEPRTRWDAFMRWSTIAMFVFLAIMSDSRGSWLMMIWGVGLAVIVSAFRSTALSGGLKSAIAAVIGVAIILTAVGTFDSVLESFGRDDSLSGRTKLWAGATAVAMDRHPIMGAGYRAFWTEEGAAGVRDYITHWVALPAHGHNGYLDTWLELGLPGCALLALFIVATSTRLSWRMWFEGRERAWAGFCVLFALFLLNNTIATVALKHTDIMWAVAVLAAIYARNAPAVVMARPVRVRVGRSRLARGGRG